MLVEKEVYGYRMYLDSDDKGLSADLWKDGGREWDCPEITREILKRGWTCLDIGANLGMYALLEAQVVGKSGTVHAIEPSARNANTLLQSILLNDFRNICLHILAIGDRDGTNEFLIRTHSNLCRMKQTLARDVEDAPVVVVPELKLDTFVKEQGIERINFLRYDIESYEIQLVAGAQETLAGMKKGSWMFGEWHTVHFEDPTKDFQDALQNVLDHGFKPRVIRGFAVDALIDVPVKDFAEVCCHKYWDQAPRIFFEKVR